jgi:hypothetical protein
VKPSKREIAQIEFLSMRGYRVTRTFIRRKGIRPEVRYNVYPPSFHNLPHIVD